VRFSLSRLSPSGSALALSLAYAAAATIWVLFSERALFALVGHWSTFPQFVAVKRLLFVALTTALLFWALSRRGAGGVDAEIVEGKPYWLAPLSVFAVVTLAIAGVGLIVYQSAHRSVTDYVEGSLEALARLKVNQVSHWVEETREDLELIVDKLPLADSVAAWRSGDRDGQHRQRVLDALLQVCKMPQYVECSLHSPYDGALWLTTGAGSDQPFVRARALAAARAIEPMFQDFHVDADGDSGSANIGFFYAVRPALNAPAVAVARVTLDPSGLLVPLAEDWPGLTRSAETLLVRRDGDNVAYLNRVRAQPPGAPLLRMPLLDKGGVAVHAVRGETGALRGFDYRETPVLAHALALPGTSWFVVSKIDEDEAYAQINAITGVSALTAIVLVLLGCGSWAIRRRYAFSRDRDRLERLMLTQRLDYLAKYANDGILLCEPDGRIVEANDRCLTMYGYGLRQMKGMHAAQLWAPGYAAQVAATFHRLEQQGSLIFETEHVRSDGVAMPVEISARVIDVDGRRRVQAIVRDIAERKRLEAERADNVKRFAELSHRVVSVQEQERRRLSSELHDRTGPNLAAIKLNLNAIDRALPQAQAPNLAPLLAESSDLLAETIADVREFCAELRPAILDYSGLVPALENSAQRLARRTGMNVRVTHSNFDGRFEPEAESLLFRIAQEALTNCVKHSGARNVTVRLIRDGEHVTLSVSDDGIGFDPARIGEVAVDGANGPGLGLLTMRERAEFAGGQFTLVSRPGHGTEVRVDFETYASLPAPKPHAAAAA
jgi:PAS domain S-box-containing protein